MSLDIGNQKEQRKKFLVSGLPMLMVEQIQTQPILILVYIINLMKEFTIQPQQIQDTTIKF